MIRKRLSALLPALALLLCLLQGCSGAQAGSEAPSPTPSPTPAEPTGDSYTLNECFPVAPESWNPHTWKYYIDEYVSQYTEMPLVDISVADDGVNFEWVYEMAVNVSDVTSDYEFRDKFGVTETEGRVYRIELNPAACWEDGTPITADTYVYSMRELLSPEMKNERASVYCDNSIAIYNAKDYYNGDRAGVVKYSPLVSGWLDELPEEPGSDGDINGQVLNPAYAEGDAVFFNADECSPFFGGEEAFADYVAAYSEFYDEFAPFVKYTGSGEYIEVDDELKTLLNAAAAFLGDDNPAAWRELCFCEDGFFTPTEWEDVGLYAADDYTLIYITASPVSMFSFLTGLSSNWIVYEDLYEAGKTVLGDGSVVTDYGCSADKYMSYGPYRLVSSDADGLVFTRNDNWYGYSDGRHAGQYRTTDIVCSVIPDHDRALELFESGALDRLELTGEDLARYRSYPRLLKTPETYMYRYVFATDLVSLEKLEEEAGDGSCKRILYYDDFRRAISLSIDRETFCAEGTAGYKPGYYLLNNLYYYDIEHDPNSIFRNSDAAKKAMCSLYGVDWENGEYASLDEAFASVTGYDPQRARELFSAAYDLAVSDGIYTPGSDIVITCICSAAQELTPDELRQEELLNRFVSEAAAGTGFEGHIRFEFACYDGDRYEAVAEGRVEMICSAWGSSSFYPFSLILAYCSPLYTGSLSKIHESNGWDPSVRTLDITADFNGDGTEETVTRSFESWAEAINDTRQFAGDTRLCMEILAQLEAGILEACRCIPWGSSASCTVYSEQLRCPVTEYNIMYEYGGIRLLDYEYTDAQWEEHIAPSDGQNSEE
ncbi:MAG: hypothetical protein K5855_02570 [Oscillospiraceae bacterium]|nr:hypothetical protein [Oscillospiraceae bacterium]